MTLVWILVGVTVGVLIGAGLGFAAALVAMSLGPPRHDGPYGMREMLVAVPSGLAWGLGLLGGHAKP